MTDKQPDALRLADALNASNSNGVMCDAAAAELRRLHEVNAELVEALAEAHDLCLDSYCISAREVINHALAKAQGDNNANG